MNKFRKFMAGRYGMDALSFALVALYLLIAVIGQAARLRPILWLSLLPLAYAAFRVFSADTGRRQRENAAFMRFVWPFANSLRGKASRMRDTAHRYFKCPQCGRSLRVPRGRGKIEITCPQCRCQFQKRT
ncbi:MAG: hypothetical protein HFG26_12040 [Provencibacterium sp.]|jgi:ribosomal protein L37AE/L43A|nr:hypothetical protein [Provencibacterium sp.]